MPVTRHRPAPAFCTARPARQAPVGPGSMPPAAIGLHLAAAFGVHHDGARSARKSAAVRRWLPLCATPSWRCAGLGQKHAAIGLAVSRCSVGAGGASPWSLPGLPGLAGRRWSAAASSRPKQNGQRGHGVEALPCRTSHALVLPMRAALFLAQPHIGDQRQQHRYTAPAISAVAVHWRGAASVWAVGAGRSRLRAGRCQCLRPRWR